MSLLIIFRFSNAYMVHYESWVPIVEVIDWGELAKEKLNGSENVKLAVTV